MAGMKIRRGTVGVAAIVTLLVLLLAAASFAKPFISFNGKFRIEYPETWEQIDYTTVDYTLSQNNSNDEALFYEAVFAQVSDSPFYTQPYLLLTVDTVGDLTGHKRDSAMAAVASGFTDRIDSTFGTDIIAHLRPDTPLYDPRTGLMAIQTDIHEGRTVTKRNLLIIHFYNRGLANFYFYAPASVWDKSLPVFLQIAQSFSTENLQANVPKESVKIADLDRKDSTRSGLTKYWPISAGVVVVIIIALAARRRRSQPSGQSGKTS